MNEPIPPQFNQSVKQASQVSPNMPRSGLAIVSVIIGIFSFIPLLGILFGIIAIVFGIISLVQIKKSLQKGKRLAIAGIVLGSLGILLTIGMFSFLFSQSLNPIDSQSATQLTTQILREDAGSIELYKKKFNKYPANLQDIDQKVYPIFPTDAFRRSIYYKASPDEKSYDLRSLGSDGVYGTSDDIFFNK